MQALQHRGTSRRREARCGDAGPVLSHRPGLHRDQLLVRLARERKDALLLEVFLFLSPLVPGRLSDASHQFAKLGGSVEEARHVPPERGSRR
jgi:hypothetical protein